jgi:hypothetical protein
MCLYFELRKIYRGKVEGTTYPALLDVRYADMMQTLLSVRLCIVSGLIWSAALHHLAGNCHTVYLLSVRTSGSFTCMPSKI